MYSERCERRERVYFTDTMTDRHPTLGYEPERIELLRAKDLGGGNTPRLDRAVHSFSSLGRLIIAQRSQRYK